MNNQEKDLIKIMFKNPFINQRLLTELSGISLGKVNQSLKTLQAEDYLDTNMKLTNRAYSLIDNNKPRNAIILAAGYGMRMIPINTEIPKGLIKVHDEVLIERLINQLHDCNVFDITIVVGFMKESYEYLIDKYNVKFKVNVDYGIKNNLHTLNLVADIIGNTYILPCDIWCGENPFSKIELYSWYMVSDMFDDESDVRVNRKQELVKTNNGGNQMIGITYITKDDSNVLINNLKEYDKSNKYITSFWEEALYNRDRMYVIAKVANSKNTYEINTFEQLREIDDQSEHLRSETLELIASVFNTTVAEIEEITTIKKGMTNRSFLFKCKEKKYIMRIPGEGTDKIINRYQEYNVYNVIKDLGICDDIYYINPNNGFKISGYFENVRVCDAEDMNDVAKCMKKLREVHEMRLEVDHTFDIFGQIDYYESLWGGDVSIYSDYNETKKKIMELKEFIDKQDKCWSLAHIDAISDNFLFVKSDNNADAPEETKIIDWEYAGMQDSCVDVAMFALYALYDREQIEQLIDAYYYDGCDKSVRLKIYSYIAVCGLLWSNWCEYKRHLGVEFGEYSLRQYRYAKDYYKIFKEEFAVKGDITK